MSDGSIDGLLETLCRQHNLSDEKHAKLKDGMSGLAEAMPKLLVAVGPNKARKMALDFVKEYFAEWKRLIEGVE